jgi:potassium efflux system protein
MEGSDVPSNAVTTVQLIEWITLRHLLVAMLLLFVMLVAVRNVPGLLEIAVLQHLPLDAALRYAIKTVTRYAIIITGSTAALSALGIGWSKVQWLIAAVSVGLGFGLQEIFANFVSGLILLFERPLRAGDIVTIGNVTGKVVQIKTRATTIQDWDRKELVVPNKEFITSHLLNWTLTDTTNRVVILVGIAYGSDVAKARQILLDVANDQEQILDEPAPSVTFDQFGDSALNLTLRAYLPDMDERLSVIHQMHERIHQRLADAGIEIPFPQRDLHLRPGDGTIHVVQSDPPNEQLP